MLFIIFVVAIGVGFAALAIVRLSRGEGGGDDPNGGGDNWRRRRGPRPRGPRPRGPEPTWWPEFEREFRSYVSAQATRHTVSGAKS
jgi:hypothetical protein